MSVHLNKLTCVLLLILPSVAAAQLELLPMPGQNGTTRQVTQLFESPGGNPTPANSPHLQPTPTATPAPDFGQVLQLPGTDLIKNGASSGQQAFQAPSNNLPFESPLVGNGIQPPNPVVTNRQTGCANGNCGNRSNTPGPQIYTGLDPNSSAMQHPNTSINSPLAGAASVFSGGIVQGGNPTLGIDGSTNILMPPIPTGSPAPCGGGGCSNGSCGSSVPATNAWAPAASIAGYGGGAYDAGGYAYGGDGGCSSGACSMDQFVEEPCSAGGGCGLFSNLLHGGGWGNGIVRGLGGCGAGPCGRQRFYGSVQYLYWWTRGQRVPALVTGSTPGTDITRGAVLGHPTTQTLLGGNRLDANGFSGGLFTIGINVGNSGNNAIEWNYFGLGDEETLFDRTGSGDQIIGRPFYNTFTDQQDAEFVSFPGLVEGRMRVTQDTDFRGYGIRWRHNLLCGNPCFTRTGGPCGSCYDDTCGGGLGGGAGIGRGGFGGFLERFTNGIRGFGCGCGGGAGLQLRSFDFLLGWRHYDLDETLRFEENLVSTSTTNGVPVGTTIDIVDTFRTSNDFDGVDFGLNWEWGTSRWGIGLLSTVAFGNNRQRAFIDGSTVITRPGEDPTAFEGGLLALESNIGTVERQNFTVIPTVGANLYYSLFPGARLTLGYNLTYFDDVLRPGNIIDSGIDPRLLPPAVVGASNRPTFVAQSDNFWAQGINLGLDFCF